jgi:hypothetical protein
VPIASQDRGLVIISHICSLTTLFPTYARLLHYFPHMLAYYIISHIYSIRTYRDMLARRILAFLLILLIFLDASIRLILLYNSIISKYPLSSACVMHQDKSRFDVPRLICANRTSGQGITNYFLHMLAYHHIISHIYSNQNLSRYASLWSIHGNSTLPRTKDY